MKRATMTAALAAILVLPVVCFSQGAKGVVVEAIEVAREKYVPEAAKWVYEQSKERGVIGASWDHYGATNVSAALKLNKKGPVFGLLGAEVLAQGQVDKLLENNAKAGRLRLFAAPALDFMWVYKGLGKIGWVRDMDLLELPGGWNFIAGPQVNLPVSGITDWTWKTHTRLFVAFTARGG